MPDDYYKTKIVPSRRRKKTQPDKSKSEPDRASLRGPGKIESRRKAASTKRVRTRAGSTKFIRKPLTAIESLQKIDRDLGTWQHQMQLRDQEKQKSQRTFRVRPPSQ